MPGVGFSGKDGTVKIGSTDIAEIRGWSFNPKSNNPKYASNKTGGYKRTVAGVKEGSGTMSGAYDTAIPFMGVIEVGTDATLKLYVNATWFFSVPAVIDDYKINVDVDNGEIVSWEGTFSANGAWTNPVAPMLMPQTLPPGTVEGMPQLDPAKLDVVANYNATVLKEAGLLHGNQQSDIIAAAKAAALESIKELIASGMLQVATTPRATKPDVAPVMTDSGLKSPSDAANPRLASNEGTLQLKP